MTDEAKALVERMEEWALTLLAACEGGDLGTDEPAALMYQARDRIEALDTQLESANEALRERLDICETQAREIERLTLTVRKLQGNQAALESEIERLRIECEFIASVTASPLINPLEVGFRHSPLTQRERETRYMEACALAYQSARAALAGDSHDQ